MEEVKTTNHEKEVVVIFNKEQIETEKETTTIYTPIDLKIGYLDPETETFITKNETYHYLLDDEYDVVFGLRMSLKYFKDSFCEKGMTLKETAYNYLEMLNDYKFYFLFETEDNKMSVAFIIEDIISKEKEDIPEPDIGIGLKYLFKKILGDDFDENIKFEYQLEQNPDILTDFDDLEEETKNPIIFDFDAKKLSDDIKTSVIGQDDAIDDIVTIIWQNQRSDNKSNILLIGPSGVGKTEIIRKLSEKLNIPMAKINITDTSQSAYFGTNIDDSIRQLIKNANYDIEKASKGIIFIDEIDKKAGSSEFSASNAMTTGVQDELLKLLEDNDYEIDLSNNPHESNIVTINTKNITFICAGAFSNMKELKNLTTPKMLGFASSYEIPTEIDSHITRDDLIKYGLKNELIGRLHNIIELHTLSKEDLIKIMKNPNNMNIQNKIKILQSFGINLNLEEEVYDLLADKALQNNTGARGLISEVDKLFIKAMKAISYSPDNFQELVISKETVKNPNVYKLIKRKK